jgi:hypothetical protein
MISSLHDPKQQLRHSEQGLLRQGAFNCFSAGGINHAAADLPILTEFKSAESAAPHLMPHNHVSNTGSTIADVHRQG